MPALDEVVALLSCRIEAGRDSITSTNSDGEPINAVRMVLGKHENEDLLETLYLRAQQIRAGEQSNELRCWIESQNRMPREFRDFVLGWNWWSDPRAKILATILCEGHEYLLEVWDRLLENIRMCKDNMDAPGFVDRSLPLTNEDAKDFLGPESSLRFAAGQHKFCPPDRSALSVDFSTVRKKIRLLIDQDATITCKNVAEGGQEVNEFADRWSPEVELQRLLESQPQLLKDLYIGWRKHAQSLPDEPQSLRQYADDVLPKSEKFCNGIVGRQRLFATLLFSPALWDSKPWEMFIDICLGLAAQSDSTLEAWSDQSLPFTMSKAKEMFGPDGHDICYHQLRFCPIKLCHGRSIGLNQQKLPPVLPLLEKAYLSEGCHGKVYRVKIAAGYYDDRCEQELAMKVISAQASTRYAEWQITEKLDSQDSVFPGIMRPVAMVKGYAEICIFMPLANCNFESLLSGESNDPELDDCLRKVVPVDYTGRLKVLRRMREVAGALKDLHYAVRDEKDLRRNTILHGDVKPTNILCTRCKKHPPDPICYHLQIADWGTSTVVYGQRHAFNPERSNRADQSGKAYLTYSALSSRFPNFPPEAEGSNLIDRPADIWGFGISFAGLIPWISGGPPAFHSFRHAVRASGEYDSKYKECYYYRTHGSQEAKIKDGIGEWYVGLIDQTGVQEEILLYDKCRYLLLHGLLECDPRKRINAKDLYDAFDLLLDPVPLRTLERFLSIASDRRKSSTTKFDALLPKPMVMSASQGTLTKQGGCASLKPSTTTAYSLESKTSAIVSHTAHSGRHKWLSKLPSRTKSGVRSRPGTPTEITKGASQHTESFGTGSQLVQNDLRQTPLTPPSGPSSQDETRHPQHSLRTLTLEQALDERDGRRAASLIDRNISVAETDRNGNTYLHRAVICDDVAVTAKLLELQPNLLLQRNDQGQTALHTCARGDLPIGLEHARLLVAKDPSILKFEDLHYRTALCIVKNKRSHNARSQEMVRFLEGGLSKIA